MSFRKREYSLESLEQRVLLSGDGIVPDYSDDELPTLQTADILIVTEQPAASAVDQISADSLVDTTPMTETVAVQEEAVVAMQTNNTEEPTDEIAPVAPSVETAADFSVTTLTASNGPPATETNTSVDLIDPPFAGFEFWTPAGVLTTNLHDLFAGTSTTAVTFTGSIEKGNGLFVKDDSDFTLVGTFTIAVYGDEADDDFSASFTNVTGSLKAAGVTLSFTVSEGAFLILGGDVAAPTQGGVAGELKIQEFNIGTAFTTGDSLVGVVLSFNTTGAAASASGLDGTSISFDYADASEHTFTRLEGTLDLAVSLTGFDATLTGSFAFQSGSTGLEIGMSGVSFDLTVGTFSLGFSGASGAWLINSKGVAGQLTIGSVTGPTIPGFNNFSFSDFSLELNTTGDEVTRTITVGPGMTSTLDYTVDNQRLKFVAVSGHVIVDVTFGSFSTKLDGTFGFQEGTTGLEIGMTDVDFSLEVGAVKLSIDNADGAWVVYSDGVAGWLSLEKVTLPSNANFTFAFDHFLLELNTTSRSVTETVAVGTGASVTLNYSGPLVALSGHFILNVKIGSFVTDFDGNIAFEKGTDGLEIGMSAVSFSLAVGTKSLKFAEVSGAWVINDYGTAGFLKIGKVTLNGISGFAFETRDFNLELNTTGKDVTTSIAVGTGATVTLDYTGEGRRVFASVGGRLITTITIGSFTGALDANFYFEKAEIELPDKTTMDVIKVSVTGGSMSFAVGSITLAFASIEGGFIFNGAGAAGRLAIGSTTLTGISSFDLTVEDFVLEFNNTGADVVLGIPVNGGGTVPLDFTGAEERNFCLIGGTIEVGIGGTPAARQVVLRAEHVVINTGATGSSHVFEVETLSGTITIGTLGTITVTAGNMAITAEGHLTNLVATDPDGDGPLRSKLFYVQVTFGDGDPRPGADKFKWPAWLPIKISKIALGWADIENSPERFILILSASVDPIPGFPVAVSGMVENLRIDVGKLIDGEFPILGFSAAAVEISGTLFGMSVSGGIVMGMIDVDATGAVIDRSDPNTISDAVAETYFYVGIRGEVTIPSVGGAGIMVGIAKIGEEIVPLQAMLMIDVPVMIEPNSGLTLGKFTAGVEFATTLSDTYASVDVLKTLSIDTFTAPTLVSWEAGLRASTLALAQGRPGGAGTVDLWSQPLTITASVSIYSAYISRQALEGQILVRFDTEGRILLIGELRFGNGNLKLDAKLYADFSDITGGVDFSFYASFGPPALGGAPPFALWGQLGIRILDAAGNRLSGDPDGTTAGAAILQIELTGGVQFTGAGVVTVLAEGSIMLEVDFSDPVAQTTSLRFAASISVLNPPGNPLGDDFAQVAGAIVLRTIDDGGTLKLELYGALKLTFNGNGLADYGLDLSAEAFLQLNTTAVDQPITLTYVGGGTELVNIKAQSFSIFIKGHIGVGTPADPDTHFLEMDGVLIVQFDEDGLTLYVEVSLAIGPAASPLLEFTATGFLRVNSLGMAARLDLVLKPSDIEDIGLKFAATFQLVFNTTKDEINYPVPPGYGTPGTITIPKSAPALGGSIDVPADPAAAGEIYFVVTASGTLTIVDTLDLVGSFSIVISDGRLALSLDATLTLPIGTFSVAAAFDVSSAGLTLMLALNLETSASLVSMGFSMSGTFLLAINTTSGNYSLAGLTGALAEFNGEVIGADSWKIYVKGSITLIDVLKLDGSFELTKTPDYLEVAITAHLGLDGLADLTISGFAGIYSDGIVLGLNLSASFGYSGLFEASGDLLFRLNTCNVDRVARLNGLNVNIVANSFGIHVQNLTLKFLSVLTITGSLDITYAGEVFRLGFTAGVDFFGLGNITAEGFFDSDGNYSLYIHGSIGIGVRGFGIFGDVTFRITGVGEGITSLSGRISGRAELLVFSFGVDVGISWTAETGRLRASVGIRINFFFFSITVRGSFDIGYIKSTITYQAGSAGSRTWADSDSGALYVNVGSRAGYRNYSESDTQEQVFVRQTSDGKIEVEVFGKKKKYERVTSVHIDTGGDDDYVQVDSSVTVPVFINAGSGDDYVDFNSPTGTTIYAGDGNDTINGGSGDDIIYGEGGIDVIRGFGGNDTLHGGDGDDALIGGEGLDILWGEAGNDAFAWLSGDGQDSTIDGGDGINTLNIDATDLANVLAISPNDANFAALIDGTRLAPNLVQRLYANMRGGADSVTINHLGGTIVSGVDIALGLNDGASDSIVVYGTAGNDVFRLDSRTQPITTETTNYNVDPPVTTTTTVNTPVLTLSKFASTTATTSLIEYRVMGGLDAGDYVRLEAGGGDDYIDAGYVSDACVALRLYADSGNDTVIGSDHNDIIDGGSGDDSLTGGAGVDTFQDSAGVDTLIENRDVNFALDGWTFTANGQVESLPAVFETIRLSGGNGDNTFTVSNAATVIYLDGAEGSDTYNITVAGSGFSTINVLDGGTGEAGFSNTNVLRVNGTASADHFLLRNGLIAARPLNDISLHNEQVLFAGISRFDIYGGIGNDSFTIDETRCAGVIYGEDGADTFTVGRILAEEGDAHPTGIPYIDTTRGDLAYGNCANLELRGGDGEDYFEVNHNQAALQLYGENGDDLFLIRTFLEEGSALSNVTGGAGTNSIRYVKNGPVYINGGEGYDRLVLEGTEADDVFIVTDRDIFGGGRKIEFEDIESIVILCGDGDDTVWVLGNGLPLEIIGGSGNDTVNIGGQAPDYVFDAPEIVIDPPAYTVYDPIFREAFSISFTIGGHWDFGGAFPWFRWIPRTTYSFYFPRVIIGWQARVVDPLPYVYDPPPKTYHFANVTNFNGVVNGVEVYNSTNATPVVPGPGITPDERYNLGTIAAPVKVTGGIDSGTVGGDRLIVNMTGTTADLTGRMLTTTAKGMLVGDATDETGPVGQILGLGLPNSFTSEGRNFMGGILFDGLETALFNLGSGNDTFTVESTFGGVDVTLNGNGGNDHYILHTQDERDADADRFARIDIADSGTGPGEVNTLSVYGTAGADEILVRNARIYAQNLNNLARHNEQFTFSGITKFEIFGGNGRDTIIVDEAAIPGKIYTQNGDDTIVIGRILTEPADIASTTCISTTRGQLSIGNRALLEVYGGENNDYFEVNHNDYEIRLFGENGDDLFLIRTYLEEGSALSAVDGGAGKNRLDYVECGLIKIDGGGGFDRIVVEGTDADDVFVLTGNSISVGGAAVVIDFTAVETIVLLGGGGNDTFWIVSNAVALEIVGGSGNDITYIGGQVPVDVHTSTSVYDLAGMAGPIKVTGGIDTSAGGGIGDRLVINMASATTNLVGSLDYTTEERIEPDGRVITLSAMAHLLGLGLAASYSIEGRTFMGGLLFEGIEAAEINFGSGNDQFTINNTFGDVNLTLNGNGGNDTFNVLTNTGDVTFNGGAGDDTFNLDSNDAATNGTLNSLVGAIIAVGGDGVDTLNLDDRADAVVNTLNLTQSTITGMGMAAGVTYGALESLVIGFGSGSDIVNVRGTSAETTLELNDGDEAIYVSNAAAVTTATRATTTTLAGDLGDIDAELTILAGNGRHSLMVSDATWATGRGTLLAPAVITDTSITGLSSGIINYSASASGNFADGITIWAGSGDDFVDVTSLFLRDGLRNSTSLNTGDGADTVNVRLAAAVNAFFALHTGFGNDVVDTTGGTLDMLVFGGLGADTITTGAGNHVIFGDEGVAIYLNASGVEVARFGSGGLTDYTDGVIRTLSSATTVSVAGGDDTIVTVDGDDLVLGGGGQDTIDAAGGANYILGDHGTIVLVAGVVASIASTADAFDGSDTITTLGGRDFVLGGGAGDQINAGEGDNAVAGDHGVFTILSPASFSFAAASATEGGNDTLTTGAGADTLIGGAGDDIINAGEGQNVVFGDHGTITADLTAGDVDATSSDEAIGGNDTITTGADSDLIFGGAGDDTIEAGEGANLVSGDSGSAVITAGLPVTLSTTAPTSGGVDTIVVGAGDDVIFGGTAGDSITAGEGNNVIVGDHGSATWIGGILAQLLSTDFATGGFDTIISGAGIDAVIAGPGTDTVRAGRGRNYILGDNGSIEWAAGVLVRVASAAPSVGGADTIETGIDDDVILGGAGADTITAGEGNNLVFGDAGSLGFTAGVLTTATSSDYTDGGDDQITTGAGNDVIFGGFGSDTITAGDGVNLVLGDHGVATYAGVNISEVRALAADIGGGDTITSGSGNDIVIGGAGADTITVGDGKNFVFGDAGSFAFATGVLTTATSTDYTDGGDDQITTGSGDDVIFGGFGSDTITAGEGANLVLGDHGAVVWQSGVRTRATSTASGTGGDDTITVGAGDDTILGGAAADQITAGAGANVVLGDEGEIITTAAGLVRVASTAASTGGADTIETGIDNDVIVGGAGADTIVGGEGNNLIFGDAGALDFAAGVLTTATSTAYTDGGDDLITTGAGDDVIFGGFGADTIAAGEGANLVLGDHGIASYAGAIIRELQTVAPNAGGDDTISSGSGHDVVLGGVGSDAINAGAGVNLIVGDHGTATWQAGVLTQLISTDFAVGGADTIITGVGSDVVLGGAGNDTIRADRGDNIILGDSGLIDFSSGVIAQVVSLEGAIGGDDNITTGDEVDVIFGGAGADSIWSGAGDDFVAGDVALLTAANGVVVQFASQVSSVGGNDAIFGEAGDDLIIGGAADDLLNGGEGQNVVAGDGGAFNFSTGVLVDVRALAPFSGGADTISVGSGRNIVMAGAADDTVTAGNGGNIILGDFGTLTFLHGVLVQLTPTNPEIGGDDVITVGAGADLIVGGVGEDSIDAGEGNNVVIGDHAVLDLLAGVLTRIESVFAADGAADLIFAGAGNDLVIAGTAGDTVHSGSGNDLVFGDHALVSGTISLDLLPLASADKLFSFVSIFTQNTATDGRGVSGDDVVFAGAGDDIIFGQQGSDILFGGDGDDDLVGGHNISGGQDGADIIDGGAGYDVIAGDNAAVLRTGDNNSLRVRVLAGTAIFDDRGTLLDVDAAQAWPTAVPERAITILDHAFDTDASFYAGDYLVGGAGDDMLFGQLGDDRIHGDAVMPVTISSNGTVDRESIRASAAALYSTQFWTGAASDGDDYIEGNGGADLIFGGLGQDDIVGGSSSMFGLATRLQRPDGSDTIYGGNGTAAGFEDMGDSSSDGRARDADMILGDNANIVRLVGTNGVSTGAFLHFDYDKFGSLKIIVRGFELVDYTVPGSPDDLGAADALYGEAGDDTLHGMAGDDTMLGNGQDDNLYGGQGDDIIYGGGGDDSISHSDELKPASGPDRGAASAAKTSSVLPTSVINEGSTAGESVFRSNALLPQFGGYLTRMGVSSDWTGGHDRFVRDTGRSAWMVFGSSKFMPIRSGTSILFSQSGSLFRDLSGNGW